MHSNGKNGQAPISGDRPGNPLWSDEMVKLLLRTDDLMRRGDSPDPHENLLPEALEELQTTLEELRVADEELRQQNEELMETRLEIERERQRYYDLFDFAPDAYLVTDANGTIQEANRAAAVLLNVKQRFLIGKPILVFIAGGHKNAFIMKQKKLENSLEIQEWEIQVQPRSST